MIRMLAIINLLTAQVILSADATFQKIDYRVMK